MKHLILIFSILLVLTACGIKSPTDALNEEIDKLEDQLNGLKGQRKQVVIETFGTPDGETHELTYTELVYQFNTIQAELVLHQDVFETFYLSYIKDGSK